MSHIPVNFQDLINVIERNKRIKEEGGITSISGPFDRLAQYYGGFTKGSITAITASSGVGKTKFVKYFTVHNVLNRIQNTNIKAKIFYFALEENQTDFWLSFIASYLYQHYKINISVSQLKSIGNYKLDSSLLQKIKKAEKYIQTLQDTVECVDYIRSPLGIVKYIKKYFDNPHVGEHLFDESDSNARKHTGYKYADENLWVFCIIDHISLLSNDMTPNSKVRSTPYQTFDTMVKDYILDLFSKRFKIVNVIVHQQTPSSEKAVYTNKGHLIEEKIEPSLEELHINKGVHQDYEVVIGLFNPSRYDIEIHNGYDVSILGRNYRSLKFLKDRHFGLENASLGLFFEGASGFFEELPRAEVMTTGNHYEKYREK
jgi:hypothetical protein